MPSQFRTWLQLFRAPNLFTVPGDPIAGYMLTALPGLVVGSTIQPGESLASYLRVIFETIEPALYFAITASVCLYAAGLLDNDLADLAEDRAERPRRPLPSGAARPGTVAGVAAILVVIGLVLAAQLGTTALLVSVALVGAVGLYNHFTKHLPVIGALNMGLCRGLSVLLGAAAAPHSDLLWRLLAAGRMNYLLIAIALVTLYVAAITHLARFETKASVPLVAKWLPTLTLLAGAALFLQQVRGNTFWSASAVLGVAVVGSFSAALALTRDAAKPVPPVIGQLIRLLLLVQTAFCAAAGTAGASLSAALLLIAWPLSRAVSKRFYAS